MRWGVQLGGCRTPRGPQPGVRLAHHHPTPTPSRKRSYIHLTFLGRVVDAPRSSARRRATRRHRCAPRSPHPWQTDLPPGPGMRRTAQLAVVDVLFAWPHSAKSRPSSSSPPSATLLNSRHHPSPHCVSIGLATCSQRGRASDGSSDRPDPPLATSRGPQTVLQGGE
jgi:hypothetical protein